MTKKQKYMEDLVFHAQSKPSALGDVLASLVSDVVTDIKVSGAKTITIPASSVDEDYTAVVYSQYGDVMESASVTLALKSSVTGVSISDGTVTVDSTASAGTFTITATSGTKVVEYEVTMVASA